MLWDLDSAYVNSTPPAMDDPRWRRMDAYQLPFLHHSTEGLLPVYQRHGAHSWYKVEVE